MGVQDVLILTAALKKLNTFNPHVLSMDNVEFQIKHVKLHENYKPSKYKYCLGSIGHPWLGKQITSKPSSPPEIFQ